MGVMLFIQITVNLGWTESWYKGDISTAFLQGEATQKHRNVCIEPVPELREKFGL